MNSYIGTRPDDPAVERFSKSWFENSKDHPETARLLQLVTDPKAVEFLKTQFIAACYLEECLRELQAPQDYRNDWCFRFGRACVGNDPWKVFDKVMERCEQDIRQLTERAEWADVPVPQDVPELTSLAQEWWSYARSSVGPKGLYPQPLLLLTSKDEIHVVAMAMDGNAAYKHIAEMFRRPDINLTEAIFGIDMTAMPGQNIEFEDFLAVVWYLQGEFYTGVVNYECRPDGAEEGTTAFREIDWNNNYWSHAQRSHPIPSLREAITERDQAIKEAAKIGAPPLEDLPFEPLGAPETARLIELMPKHLVGLLLQWGWSDTVLRDSLFGWLVTKVWDLPPHRYFQRGDDDRFSFEPYRDFVETGKRIPLDLRLLETR